MFDLRLKVFYVKMDYRALKLGGQLTPLIIEYLQSCERYVINRHIPHTQLWGGKYDLEFVLSNDWAVGVTPLQEAKVLLMAIDRGCINIVTYLSAFHEPNYHLVQRAIICKQYSTMMVLRKHMSLQNYTIVHQLNDKLAKAILDEWKKDQPKKKKSKCIIS